MPSSLLPIAIVVVASFVLRGQLNTASDARQLICSRRCGGIAIPYPFWISDSRCGLPPYRILCSNNSPFLLTDSGQFHVLQISPGSLIINSTDLKAESCNLSQPGNLTFTLTRQLAPFALSSNNVFVVLGCGSKGSCAGSVYDPLLSTKDYLLNFECSPSCSSTQLGICISSCCLVSIPAGITELQLTGGGDKEPRDDPRGQRCGFSTVLLPSTLRDHVSTAFGSGEYGLEREWGIILDDSSHNCSTVSKAKGYVCAQYATCEDVGFHFNRTAYFCNCSEGYSGDGYNDGTGCSPILAPALAPASSLLPSKSQMGRNVTIAILSTCLSVSILAFLLFSCLKSREIRRRKQRYFEQHGGRRLQELLSSVTGNKTPKLYSESELQKATLNFSEERRLGSGGFGTVYKGTMEDGLVVAIKKSNRVQQPGEPDRFVNEIILLSSVNHRNIVQLLGCCLETQIPLLVYEYIPNGTLSEHLQGKFHNYLSWGIRLQIALQIADALAYLHSSASPPIIHRDVKSSNVLLHDNLTAKVADFGVSRLVAPDQSHVSTLVQGTFGYLDPQYFETLQLTEKSDVYSFGVVLLELITSLSPVSKGGNLVSLCLTEITTGNFSELRDSHLNISMGSPEMSSIDSVAELAAWCLSEDGHSRPSMRDVTEELHKIQLCSSNKERIIKTNGEPDREGEEDPYLLHSPSHFSSGARFDSVEISV